MEPLQPDTAYHVYNRANGSERMFYTKENYRYFLQKYQEHIAPVADTFCYCLMPNHFHFLIRVKGERELKTLEAFKKYESTEKMLSKAFSNFFSAYTQAFNKQNGRMGSLFMKNFKRKRIENQSYLLNLVCYIHQNPVSAKLCQRPEFWPQSSYSAIVNNENTFVKKSEVLEWFVDLETFRSMHCDPPEAGDVGSASYFSKVLKFGKV